MRRIAITLMLILIVAVLAFGTVQTVRVHATGQPNQSCQAEPSSPGNASSAPGSAFNENPGGVAGAMYAGSQPQNSNNPNSVSQYDVACYQVSNH